MGDQDGGDDLDRFRTGRAYTVTDAARFAGTSYQNVYRWLRGYEAPGHWMQPVFGQPRERRAGEVLMLSFLELVEVAVAVRFRRGASGRAPIPLARIRSAHEFAREKLGEPYPFANLDLRTMGGHILAEFDRDHPGPNLVVMSAGGQMVLPEPVRSALESIEFGGDRWARKWFPRGRDAHIVINPMIAAGQPTIEGTGVTVLSVRDRFRAGDTIKLLADDYDVGETSIEEALRFAA